MAIRPGARASQRTGRVHVRSVVHPDRQPIHQFSAEPSGEQRQAAAGERQRQRHRSGDAAHRSASPSCREHQDDDDVADTVYGADTLGPCA